MRSGASSGPRTPSDHYLLFDLQGERESSVLLAFQWQKEGLALGPGFGHFIIDHRSGCHRQKTLVEAQSRRAISSAAFPAPSVRIGGYLTSWPRLATTCSAKISGVVRLKSILRPAPWR